jgi:hypothetical protein
LPGFAEEGLDTGTDVGRRSGAREHDRRSGVAFAPAAHTRRGKQIVERPVHSRADAECVAPGDGLLRDLVRRELDAAPALLDLVKVQQITQ